MHELTHFNRDGRARMENVTDKTATRGRAVASGVIYMAPVTLAHFKNGTIKKGDVLAVAQVAGIQAAKCTWEFLM